MKIEVRVVMFHPFVDCVSNAGIEIDTLKPPDTTGVLRHGHIGSFI